MVIKVCHVGKQLERSVISVKGLFIVSSLSFGWGGRDATSGRARRWHASSSYFVVSDTKKSMREKYRQAAPRGTTGTYIKVV